jgi:hypothetical protein
VGVLSALFYQVAFAAEANHLRSHVRTPKG